MPVIQRWTWMEGDTIHHYLMYTNQHSFILSSHSTYFSIYDASLQRHKVIFFFAAFRRHSRWAVSIKKENKLLFNLEVVEETKCSSPFSWGVVTERASGQSHSTEHQWFYSEWSQHSKTLFLNTSFRVLGNSHWNVTSCSTECCVRRPVRVEAPGHCYCVFVGVLVFLSSVGLSGIVTCPIISCHLIPVYHLSLVRSSPVWSA